jgi:hypothetical protein
MWNPEKVKIIKKAIDPKEIVSAKNTAYLENHSKRSRRLRGRDI